MSVDLGDDVFVVGASGFFVVVDASRFLGSSALTVKVWSDGVVVVADGNGSANEWRIFATAVSMADTTGALASRMT